MTWPEILGFVFMVYGLITWNVWVRKYERRMMEMRGKEEK